jgi:3-hydroxyacyl-[acyl-carrier-protein] dehydratase
MIFKFIDRVLEQTEDKIVAIKNVTITEPYFRDHVIDGSPVLPGSITLETIGQAADILLGTTTYLAKIEYARFYEKIIPGDQLRIEVVKLRSIGKIHKLHGIGLVDGKKYVELKFTLREDDE